MFDTKTVEIEWGGKTLKLETGRVARQADGAVLATLGETVVLCAVTAAKSVKPGQDFFPLTVHYQEKFSAAGRIPGGFFKRERGATEKETLTSRLIDRPIRPLFPEGFYNEILVIAQVMSYDGENEPDILAMIAASAALTLSGVPFMGPIAGARVGFKDGEYQLNPHQTAVAEGSLDLVVAGTRDAVMMVESEAKELSEEEMLGAVMFAHRSMQPVIEAIIKLAEQAAKEPWELAPSSDKAAIKGKLKDLIGKDVEVAYKLTSKQDRQSALAEARAKAAEAFAESDPQEQLVASKLVKSLEADIVRGAILKEGRRIDGRDTKTVRPIEAIVGFFPRTHGSALFTRGETQAICTTTLGTKEAEQMIDGLEGLSYQRFMLHYNFPPYSVGEVGRFGAPGRREVGHGKLAWRALHPMLPSIEEFPYTIRVLSDITKSNGSSSMATVCGGSLAMMDAGVPLKRPVSGIAMGLILEGKDFAVISDILGDEDHLGDMDFKVAGTSEGITSLQMDIKIAGITEEIMRIALRRPTRAAPTSSARWPRRSTTPVKSCLRTRRASRRCRSPRTRSAKSSVPAARSSARLSRRPAPRSTSTTRERSRSAPRTCRRSRPRGNGSRHRRRAEVGTIYTGKVASIVDFGAFVTFMPGKDGLVHVSEIKNERVENVRDVLQEGQEVKVKLLEVDQRGKVRLSMRLVDQETGEELPDTRPPSEPREGGDRGPRGDRGRHGRGDRDRGPRRDGGRGGDRDRGPRREGGERGESRGDRGPRPPRELAKAVTKADASPSSRPRS